MATKFSCQTTAPTSGATVDLDYGSDVGLPVGAIFILTRSGTPNDDVDAYMSIGCADGTNEWAYSMVVPFNLATIPGGDKTGQTRAATTRSVLLIDNAGFVLGSLSFSSFSGGGGSNTKATMTVDTAFPSGYTVTTKFYVGGQAAVGTYVAGAATEDTVTTGFEPDAIPLVVGSIATMFDDSPVQLVDISAGMAGWDRNGNLTQSSMAWRATWVSLALGYATSIMVDESNVYRLQDGSAADDYITISGRTPTGFTSVKTSVLSGGLRDVGYFAYQGSPRTDCRVAVDRLTSSSPITFSGYGRVGSLAFLSCGAATKGSVVTNFVAGAFGIGVATGETEEFGHTIGQKDGLTAGTKSGTVVNGTSPTTGALLALGWGAVAPNLRTVQYGVQDSAGFGPDGFTLVSDAPINFVYFIVLAESVSPTVRIKGNVLVKGNVLIK